MNNTLNTDNIFKKYQSYILLFSVFFVSLLAYGYSLTNFSLSIDNETKIVPNYSLPLGRWGTNLIRYHIFGVLLPYYTLLFSLFFMSLATVIITKLLKLNFLYSFLFSILFITIPQLSYQFVFLMQADVIAIGFLSSSIALTIYINKVSENNRFTKWIWLAISAILIMFVIACYQGLFFIPIITFLAYLYTKSYSNGYNFKNLTIDIIKFCGFIFLGALLYYISIKTLFKMHGSGNFGGYTSGDYSNVFSTFFEILWRNLKGTFYYGENTYVLTPIAAVLLIIYNFINKKNDHLVNIVIILGLLIIPFLISLPITNYYHPPRLYVSSGISFAFLIILALKIFNNPKLNFWFTTIVIAINIFFITNLYYTNHKIYEYDVKIANRINNDIITLFPNLQKDKVVYFYGQLPIDNLNHIILPNSEIFGGSIFSWDNGSNTRLIDFYNFLNINQFKLLNDKELFNKIEPNISNMTVWPNVGSIQEFNDVIIVKLSEQKGKPLPCEY